MKKLLLILLFLPSLCLGESFGHRPDPGDNYLECADTVRGSIFTMPEDGIVTGCTLWVRTYGSGMSWKAGIWKASDSELVTCSDEHNLTGYLFGMKPRYIAFSGNDTLSGGTDYAFGAIQDADDSPTYSGLYYDASTGDTLWRDPHDYTSSCPDPFVKNYHSVNNDKVFCIEIYYTAVSLGPPNYIHGPDGHGVRHSARGRSHLHGVD